MSDNYCHIFRPIPPSSVLIERCGGRCVGSITLQSSMVSQLELQGVWVQIELLLKVQLIIEAYVVIDEGYGYDEGDMPLAIEVNDLQQLLPLSKRDLFLKMPRNVLQYIVMLRRGGLEAQGLYQELLILLIERADRHACPLVYQSSHVAIVSGAVGEYQQLMLSVKLYQCAATALTH